MVNRISIDTNVLLDCLQMECVKSYGAEYIITTNVADYVTSEVKAIMPKDYLKL